MVGCGRTRSLGAGALDIFLDFKDCIHNLTREIRQSAMGIYRELRNWKPRSLRIYWPDFGDSVKQGWYGEEESVLFDDSEASSASDNYGISQALPGFKVIGLRGTGVV